MCENETVSIVRHITVDEAVYPGYPDEKDRHHLQDIPKANTEISHTMNQIESESESQTGTDTGEIAQKRRNYRRR